MIIRGLQKCTLLDYPGKVACTIFTEGCNFACPFCQNASLVRSSAASDPIAADDVLSFLQKRCGLLDGVCISGGEPLLQTDLAPFLERIRSLGFAVKLDTNGSMPDRLEAIVRAGLVDMVAMDIKNAPDRYAETIGRSSYDLSPIQESIAFLRTLSGHYEFRTTVVRELHTIDDITAIARWISGAERYFLQSFVDSGDVLTAGLHPHTPDVLHAMLDAAQQFCPSAALRGIE